MSSQKEAMETTSSCSVDLWSTGKPKPDPEDQDLSSIDNSYEEEEDCDNEREGDEDDDSSEDDDSENFDSSEEDSDSESETEEKLKFGGEWDKDSYDGYEYHSESNSDVSDMEDELNWRRYKRQSIESKGFYVDPENIPRIFSGGIYSFMDDLEDYRSGEGLTKRENCTGWANLCLEKFNQEHGSNVKLEDVLWVNRRPSAYRFPWPKILSDVYFITFVAKEEFESPDAPLVEYQAKMETNHGDIHLIFCRPSLNPTWMREKLDWRKNMREAKRNEAEELHEED